MKVKQFVIAAVSLLAAVSVFASNEIADIAEKGISIIVGEERRRMRGVYPEKSQAQNIVRHRPMKSADCIEI